MKKKALITGINGQDGAYLSKLLLDKNYEVYGAIRRGASEKTDRLDTLGVTNKIRFVDSDLLEISNIYQIIEDIAPTEIYNLAAQSFVPTSFSLPLLTSDINAMGCLRMLDSIKRINREIRFYQASTSEMFGKVAEIPQTENTKLHPRSPYGVSKVYSHYMTINYRETYDIFACSGILFNHESPLRGKEFVTRKITSSLNKIKYGLLDCMEIGNMNAERDWGFAGDYVRAMWLMLNADHADDYVIASGEKHSIREFIKLSLHFLDIDAEWEGEGLDEKVINKSNGNVIIKVNPKYFRPAEVNILIGSPEKAKKELSWEPEVKFEELVKMMVEYDTKLIKPN